MNELETYTCIPCSRGEHHQCRPEWECGCNHLRDLTPLSTAAPAAATNQLLRRGADEVAAAGGTVEDGEVSTAPRPGSDAFVASGPGSPRCRFAGGAHVCRSSFGMPLDPGQRCYEEAKAVLAADHPLAVGELRIRNLDDVAVRLAEKLAPMDRAVGQ